MESFFTKEYYRVDGSTISSGVSYSADSGIKTKSDALMANATCYVTFDSRGLTVYKDDAQLYNVPGIKTLKVAKDGDKYFLYFNDEKVSKNIQDAVQQSADDYYYFNKDGLTLTSYGDLMMTDETVWGESTPGYKLFQTKNFSLARYHLITTKKVIDVASNVEPGYNLVPVDKDYFTWDTGNSNFTSTTSGIKFMAQSNNSIWAVLKITPEGKLQALTSDRDDKINAIQWDYNELFDVTEKITSFSVKADGLYVNSTRVNKKALENAATMYFCLDGDLILCDNAGNMLWSLYVEAASFERAASEEDEEDDEDDEDDEDKDTSFWEKYKWYVMGGGGGLCLCCFCVFMFIIMISMKKPPK
jgi:hypothetical protein